MQEMVKKIIDRVTVTGADDNISPLKMVKVFQEYPFVEFGILLSKKQAGSLRFPSLTWLHWLHKTNSKLENKLPLSAHLCGAWVRDICVGGNCFFRERANISDMFQRFQLNFHGEKQIVNQHQFSANIARLCRLGQFILQMDGVNDDLLGLARKYFRMDVAPLFDLSGGAGVLPKEWPKGLSSSYCGYAGGLAPANLSEQMERIAEVAGAGPIWIDAETLLRSNHDTLFDLDKVRAFLEAAKPWIIGY